MRWPWWSKRSPTRPCRISWDLPIPSGPFANQWCRFMRKPIRFILLTTLLAAGFVFAGFSGSDIVPLDHEAIQYSKAPVDDLVARLGRRIARGEVKLAFENNGMGHLRSLLKHLGVNIDSQVLVFSKTSFQAPRIFPRMPRAIYFGDDVSVGWVRGGEVLELAALDP